MLDRSCSCYKMWLQHLLSFLVISAAQGTSPTTLPYYPRFQRPLYSLNGYEIDVVSLGNPGDVQGGLASIKINGVEHARNKRGYNVVALNPTSGEITSEYFDTHAEPLSGMINFLNALSYGTIIAIAVKDEASSEARWGRSYMAVMKSLGAGQPDSVCKIRLGYRDSWAMITKKVRHLYDLPDWFACGYRRVHTGRVDISTVERLGYRIDVESGGKKHGDVGSIRINGVQYSRNERGYNVVVLNPVSGDIVSGAFDTHAHSVSGMIEFLNEQSEGSIIAIAAKDDATASARFSTRDVLVMEALGVGSGCRLMSFPAEYRYSWAMITKKVQNRNELPDWFACEKKNSKVKISAILKLECPKVNLMFLLDGSGSVSARSFLSAKNWINDVVRTSQLHDAGWLSAGVVQYATNPSVEIPLGHHSNMNAFEEAVSDIVQVSGNTDTEAGIMRSIGAFSTVTTDGRKNILVLLTDGESDSDNDVRAAGIAARNAGIRIIAVGIDNADLSELQIIANDQAGNSNDVFIIDDHDDLHEIAESVVNLIAPGMGCSTSQGYEDTQCMSNGWKYTVSPPMTWSESRQWCRNNFDGDLAVAGMQDYASRVDIMSYLDYPSGGLWIGMKNSDTPGNQWRWLDGSPVDGATAKWAPGEPNNVQRNGVGEHCGNFYPGGEWSVNRLLNDDTCSFRHPGLCAARCRSGRGRLGRLFFGNIFGSRTRHDVFY